jgi:transaldolase
MNRIQQLYSLGQSIWLDYIERGMVRSGELKALVEEGVAGVTSNPTIFQQAIGKSDAYKADLKKLVNGSLSDKDIFESLAVADIQAAADILRPVYDRSGGMDGFVSIEVAPDLAYDTEATIAEAHKLWDAVDRPNLMVKVPATAAGIPAIRQLIADGLNINVTLIFALSRYAEVKEAYLSGLEDRQSRGLPIHSSASVASFFVSRVDSSVDAELEKLAKQNPDRAAEYQSLMGKIAVANAKLAYRQFQQVFSGPRWEKLAASGAQVQRPLWASTSTKNPSYPELLYVETLMGPHTVNTMPPKTLEAFRERGVIERTVDQDLESAQAAMDKLAALGIRIDAITDDLEADGVKKFADSYTDLLGTIQKRRQELVAA